MKISECQDILRRNALEALEREAAIRDGEVVSIQGREYKKMLLAFADQNNQMIDILDRIKDD